EHFFKKYSVQYNKPYNAVSPETMRLLMEYEWPGNVRELENLVKRAVVLGSEVPVRQELARGIALAEQRAAARLPVSSRPNEPAGTRAPDFLAATAPAAIARAACDAGHYSLKDISRTAAREAEREVIQKMLQRTHWNRKETAAILGISYKALLYK